MLLALVLGAALILACGDDDDNGGGASEELTEAVAEVCTETEDVLTEEELVLDMPQPGDEIVDTLRLTGQIAAFGGQFWISLVTGEGEHLIDAPRMTMDVESEALTPFDVEFPVQPVSEDTPACVWVYRRNVVDPEDAVRVPVMIVPEAES
jgi:Immunoglobulin-like domain of bacterial spore germination